jgi:hypothetical protein
VTWLHPLPTGRILPDGEGAPTGIEVDDAAEQACQAVDQGKKLGNGIASAVEFIGVSKVEAPPEDASRFPKLRHHLRVQWDSEVTVSCGRRRIPCFIRCLRMACFPSS